MSRFIMDNFRIDVTGRQGWERDGNPLEDLIKFLMHDSKIEYYAIRDSEEILDGRKPKRVVFYRYECGGAKSKGDLIKHPWPMDYKSVANFCLQWLNVLPNEDYEDEIDIDGSLDRGWRVYNEAWGHVDRDWGALFAVAPNWAWIGK